MAASTTIISGRATRSGPASVSSLLVRKPATELAAKATPVGTRPAAGDEHDLGLPGEQFGDGEPVHIRELDVQKHQIGAKRSGSLKRGSPVRRLGGDGKAARLEKRTSGLHETRRGRRR